MNNYKSSEAPEHHGVACRVQALADLSLIRSLNVNAIDDDDDDDDETHAQMNVTDYDLVISFVDLNVALVTLNFCVHCIHSFHFFLFVPKLSHDDDGGADDAGGCDETT